MPPFEGFGIFSSSTRLGVLAIPQPAIIQAGELDIDDRVMIKTHKYEGAVLRIPTHIWFVDHEFGRRIVRMNSDPRPYRSPATCGH